MSLSDKLGHALDFEIDGAFNQELPIPIRCRSCNLVLLPATEETALVYRHQQFAYGWCKPNLAFSIGAKSALEATLRFVLARTGSKSDETISERLRRCVHSALVMPIGAGQIAIGIDLIGNRQCA